MEPLGLTTLRQAWYGFTRLLTVATTEQFLCPDCGQFPETLTMDGHALGLRQAVLDELERRRNRPQKRLLPRRDGHYSSAAAIRTEFLFGTRPPAPFFDASPPAWTRATGGIRCRRRNSTSYVGSFSATE